MPGEPQPLADKFAIVNPDGTPTQYFIRWAQARQIDIQDGISAAQAQTLIDDWAAARHVNAGTGLAGGGTLDADVTLSLNAGLGNLNDVDLSTPPTNGQVLKYDDADEKWKPGTGGGGGGGGLNILACAQMHDTGSPALGGSYNVASITKPATGVYRFTFTTALANVTDALVHAIARFGDSGGEDVPIVGVARSTAYSGGFTVNYVDIACKVPGSGFSDVAFVWVGVYSTVPL